MVAITSVPIDLRSLVDDLRKTGAFLRVDDVIPVVIVTDLVRGTVGFRQIGGTFSWFDKELEICKGDDVMLVSHPGMGRNRQAPEFAIGDFGQAIQFGADKLKVRQRI